MSSSEKALPRSITVGVMAERLRKPIFRVEYILKTRNIVPVGWAGHARIYAEDALKRVAAEFREMEKRTTQRTAGKAK